MQAALSLENVTELRAAFIAKALPPHIARMAPSVTAAAERGIPLARAVCDNAAKHLARAADRHADRTVRTRDMCTRVAALSPGRRGREPRPSALRHRDHAGRVAGPCRACGCGDGRARLAPPDGEHDDAIPVATGDGGSPGYPPGGGRRPRAAGDGATGYSCAIARISRIGRGTASPDARGARPCFASRPPPRRVRVMPVPDGERPHGTATRRRGQTPPNAPPHTRSNHGWDVRFKGQRLNARHPGHAQTRRAK